MSKSKKDLFNKLLKELYKVRNPHLDFKQDIFQNLKNQVSSQVKKETILKGRKDTFLPKKAFLDLTTSRNKNLIFPDEQDVLRKTVVAFFGLSVGSHAAITWAMLARPDAIKIADYDRIDATNLNRIQALWNDLGVRKVDYVEDRIIGMNPYTKIYKHVERDASKIEPFIRDNTGADLIVDEVDNLHAKIILRRIARDRKIPIITVADVGDNVIMNIERYDLDVNTVPFLGRLSQEDIYTILQTNDEVILRKMIIKLVGLKGNSERMSKSLFAINGSISTWPQLGATATIAGGLITTTIKKIILGEKVISGRYYLSLDDLLVSDYKLEKNIKKRNTLIKQLELVLQKNDEEK